MVDNTYTLCMVVDGAYLLAGGNPNKTITVLTNEVTEGRITYVKTKLIIK
jgi:hypothetical protein